jgi:predicted DNA binding CopG/RHH family protein
LLLQDLLSSEFDSHAFKLQPEAEGMPYQRAIRAALEQAAAGRK